MEEKQAIDLPKKRIIEFETGELVDELSSRRESVECSRLSKSASASVRVDGPAVVLVAKIGNLQMTADPALQRGAAL